MVAPGSHWRRLRRVLLAIVLTVSAALLAFAGGTVLGGKYFVPPGQGLAGPVEAMGYGLLAALPAMALAIFVSVKLAIRALSLVTAMAFLLAFGLYGVLIVTTYNEGKLSYDAPQGPQKGQTKITEPVMAEPESQSPQIPVTVDSVVPASPVKARATQTQVQTCYPSERLHAHAISGEVYGEHDLILDAAPSGLRLALLRERWGWRIAVLDAAANDQIPASTLRGGLPDPREIYGWHFRNADNTGANMGEVNAPQRERRFAFMTPADSETASGLGWLIVEDFSLTDLEPGQQARMMSLRFKACLMQQKTAAEIATEANFASLDFLPEDEELMHACGLDTEDYVLEAPFPPRLVGGDFDGDGALDNAAYVLRIADGRHAIAICRAGTWLDVIGPGGIDLDLKRDGKIAAYIQKAEAWRAGPMAGVPVHDGEAERPDVQGDVLTLERVEKSAYSLYRTDGVWRAWRHYRFVEP